MVSICPEFQALLDQGPGAKLLYYGYVRGEFKIGDRIFRARINSQLRGDGQIDEFLDGIELVSKPKAEFPEDPVGIVYVQETNVDKFSGYVIEDSLVYHTWLKVGTKELLRTTDFVVDTKSLQPHLPWERRDRRDMYSKQEYDWEFQAIDPARFGPKARAQRERQRRDEEARRKREKFEQAQRDEAEKRRLKDEEEAEERRQARVREIEENERRRAAEKEAAELAAIERQALMDSNPQWGRF